MLKKLVVSDCGGVGLLGGTAAECEADSLSKTMDGSEVVAW